MNTKWTVTLYRGSSGNFLFNSQDADTYRRTTELCVVGGCLSFVDEQGRKHKTNLPWHAKEEENEP